MPRSLDIGRYPKLYIEIADAFEAGLTERLLRYETREDQLRARMDLYGFLGALRRERATYPRACFIRVFASKAEPWTLRLVHADHTYQPAEIVK